MGNLNITFNEWRTNLRGQMEAAEREKLAAALKAKDPQDNGELGVPSYNTEAVRSNLNLPTNPTSNTVQDKDGTHGLCTVTKPNAVGEGEYPTAIDGDARDAAFKTPSTPLSKIANEEQKPADEQKPAEEQKDQEQQPAAEPQEGKEAAAKDNFELPADLKGDAGVIQKLAFCGNLILGDEKGQRLVAEILTKEAGRAEAQNILASVYEDIENEVNAYMNKMAGEGDPSVMDQAGLLWDKVKQKGSQAVDKASEMAGTAGDAIKGWGSDVADASVNAYNKVVAGGKDMAGQVSAWIQGSSNVPGIGQVPNWLIASLLGAGGAGLGYAGYKGYQALAGGDQEKSGSINKVATQTPEDPGMLAGWLQKAKDLGNKGVDAVQGAYDDASNAVKGAYNDASNAVKGAYNDASAWMQGSSDVPGIGQVPNWLIASLLGAGGAGLGYAGYKGYQALAGGEQPAEGAEKLASYDACEDMFKSAHAAWLNTFETDIEKAAYMQGATDAAAAAEAAQDPEAAAAMGGEIPADDSQLSDEEVMAVIQQMIQNGEISEEQVNALLQQIATDQATSYSAEQLAELLAQDVQNGTVSREEADQIAEAILNGMQSGQIASGGAAEEAPAQEPTQADQAMEVQASVNRTLGLLNNLG